MATIAEFINKIGFKVKNEDVNKVNGTISNIKQTASRVLGAIGIGFSLTAINGLVEEFTRINNQVKNSTAGLEDQVDIQQKILKAATATRSQYAQTAGMVSDLVKENSELFGTIDEAVKFNNAATMLFKTAGKTNEEIAGLMEAINKSFAKGYIDSETLSQLLERSPEAVELLNKKLGTTSSQLEELAADGKFTVADLKDAFVDNAATIEAAFGNVKMSVTDAITVIRNKWGLWLADTNEMLGVTDVIGKGMVTAFDGAMRVITKVRTGLVWLSEKLGGTENMLKLIAIVAGSIFLAMNFPKILGGFASIMKFLTTINFKMLGIAAIITLVALLIDDFFNFMKGNNSILGDLLEQAGVDVNAVRETIIKAWEAIGSFLETCWNAIVAVGKATFTVLVAFWNVWGNTIKTFFKAVWDVIKTIFSAALNVLTALFQVFATLFSGNWSGLWEAVKALLAAIWDAIASIIGSALNGIANVLSSIWNTIVTNTSAAFATIQSTISGAWESVKSTTSSIWEGIKTAISNAINTAWTTVSNVITKLKSAFNFSWSLPHLKLPHITVTGGEAPYGIGGKGSLPKFNIQWYKEGGILDGAQIFGRMGNTLLGGGEAGKEAVIPLTELWKNMKTIIKGGVDELVQIMKPMTGMNSVSNSTVSTVTTSSVNRSVVQNVEFHNEFHGEPAVQKNAAKTMNQAAHDTTAEMSRALAFLG